MEAQNGCREMLVHGNRRPRSNQKTSAQPQLYQEDIPYESKCRFLGLMIDDKLSFDSKSKREHKEESTSQDSLK